MLSTNKQSTASGSLIAKSRCYWKFVTERLSESQLFCWEHGRSDELCLDLEQDLRVLLAGGRRGWALGPPCSCSATFLSIFHAATQNGSNRNVCYYSGVFAFQVFFPGSILGKNVGARQPTISSSQKPGYCGKWSHFVRAKLKHIATI